ncbi:MAG TPA: preprotein translocase subunit SecG [Alphaproteobacteria bacterium]|nr:preprotein translocase subunit SecG [Alphaproteobacteria bacterium]
MTAVLVVIHMILAIALIAVVLLQRSEGGALGIGGGGGMSGFMTGRGAANLLTRTTAILAAAFMLVSLTLAFLASHAPQQRSIIDQPATKTSAPAIPSPPATPTAPTPAPAAPPANAPASGTPAAPSGPQPPAAQ